MHTFQNFGDLKTSPGYTWQDYNKLFFDTCTIKAERKRSIIGRLTGNPLPCPEKNEKDWKIDVKTMYKSFIFMVSWLDRGKTFAVLKKQIQSKQTNRKTQTYCPAAIMSSCKTLRLSTMSWMSSTFQKKRCERTTCRRRRQTDVKKKLIDITHLL